MECFVFRFYFFFLKLECNYDEPLTKDVKLWNKMFSILLVFLCIINFYLFFINLEMIDKIMFNNFISLFSKYNAAVLIILMWCVLLQTNSTIIEIEILMRSKSRH